jgi:hypothetical protein
MEVLSQYISVKLPKKLEKVKHKKQAMLERQQMVDRLCTDFVYEFLHQTYAGRFFYISATKLYLEYWDDAYIPCKVDDIHVCISEYIRHHPDIDTLTTHRTAIDAAVFANIHSTPISTTIPTPNTINHTFQQLVPEIFPSKSDAKLFLTAVGDQLLGKETSASALEIGYYYPESAHSFMEQMSIAAFRWFGGNAIRNKKTGVLSSFFCKRQHTQIILLNMNATHHAHCKSTHFLITMLSLACHYSERYDNAIGFLTKHCPDDHTITHAQTFLENSNSNSNSNSNISTFCDEWPTTDAADTRVVPKEHVYFAWRQFLRTKRIPIYLFNSAEVEFPTIVCSSSKTLFSELFVKFWDNTVFVVSTSEVHQRLEISELAQLFRQWLSTYSYTCAKPWDNDQLADAIQYFYPNTPLESSDICAYSLQWNKKQVVTEFINGQLCVTDQSRLTSLLAYQQYCVHVRKNTSEPVVSKPYFDQIWGSVLPEYTR